MALLIPDLEDNNQEAGLQNVTTPTTAKTKLFDLISPTRRMR
jgi:hypothetical protein